jgi:L-ascorbate metabolism protein UlaG (beta-lactamase superfamily)
VRVTWLGHATVVIETAAGRLVTDPVLRSRVAHLRRHAGPASVPEGVDGVLISHVHHDHFDLPSVRAIRAPVLGPPGTARAARRLGLPVRELVAGQTAELAGATVLAVVAVHDGRRWPTGQRRDDDAIGFVVEAEGQRIYFAGDTEIYDDMRKLGPLDVALVPIWGWGTSLGPGHMNPSEAAASVALLAPATAVPIHWGTFLPLGAHRRHAHLLHEPVSEFREQVARLAPGVRVEVLEPGGSLVVAGAR